MKIIDKIIRLTDEGEEHTIEIRRAIHRKPELSFQEIQTAELVRKELDSMGIPYEISPVETGTIAVIDSGRPGKLLLLRADMDALPIPEKTGLPFASEIPNVMHACGHDVHTANLLAVASVLNQMKEDWCGRVKLIFQPAEERGGGGREMIKNGLFDEIPDACIAMHTDTGSQGVITVGKGSVTAFSDGCQIVIHGKSTHSSKPQTGVDAVQIAATVITALYQITAKNISPLAASTLNISLLSGGSASNIVPDRAEFRVMMRNADKESRRAMFESVERITKGIAETMGGSAELEFHEGYAAVENNDELVDFVNHLIVENSTALYHGICEVPEKYLETGNQLHLGAEDFGFYAQKAPSCFIQIGTGTYAPAHNEHFQVDEEYIKLFTRLMALTAVEFLKEEVDSWRQKK